MVLYVLGLGVMGEYISEKSMNLRYTRKRPSLTDVAKKWFSAPVNEYNFGVSYPWNFFVIFQPLNDKELITTLPLGEILHPITSATEGADPLVPQLAPPLPDLIIDKYKSATQSLKSRSETCTTVLWCKRKPVAHKNSLWFLVRRLGQHWL